MELLDDEEEEDLEESDPDEDDDDECDRDLPRLRRRPRSDLDLDDREDDPLPDVDFLVFETDRPFFFFSSFLANANLASRSARRTSFFFCCTSRSNA